MSVGNYCRRDPVTARPDDSIREAAKRMHSNDVGCVVVVDANEHPLGILTDRDVVILGLGRSRDLDATPVSAVMSRLTAKVREVTAMARAIVRMGTDGVRRLPVVDHNGRLTGIVTYDDALKIVVGNLSIATEAIEAQFPAQREEGAARGNGAWELPIARRYRYEPVVAHPATPISAIVDEMEESSVGCVVVVDEQRIPVGIVTDRDLLRRVVAAGLDRNGEVGKVMTQEVVTVPEEASLRSLLSMARDHAIRRLPLVDEAGAIAGVVSLDDVIAALSTELEQLSHAVRVELSRPVRFTV